MGLETNEILETIRMIEMENLDIRTVTLGINLLDCKDSSPLKTEQLVEEKILSIGNDLKTKAQEVEDELGIPVVNKRISITPISLIGGGFSVDDFISLGKRLDSTAEKLGVDFIGGFSALVHKGYTETDKNLIASIPKTLRDTDRLCGSVSVASTKSGVNVDAVKNMGEVIKETAELTKEQGGIGAAKLVVFSNPVEDNPFMAGAFHGPGESEATLNVGVSGPGVVLSAIKGKSDLSLDELSDIIKKTVFKVTRAGELVGKRVAEKLGVPFGILDLSLAPTNAKGDSIAQILEEIGLTSTGVNGTTLALAMLNDAVKKGGAMASTSVGGLSGAFIPVSEDNGMIDAVNRGSLSLSKLEAMTSVCSVGLDMIALPGDISPETISYIIGDEMAIGVINKKTTAARLVPAPGKKPGDMVEYGGLLGRAPVMDIKDPEKFNEGRRKSSLLDRGGRRPAPIQGLNN